MLQLFLEAHWSLNNTPSIKSFPRYKMFSFNHIHYGGEGGSISFSGNDFLVIAGVLLFRNLRKVDVISWRKM